MNTAFGSLAFFSTPGMAPARFNPIPGVSQSHTAMGASSQRTARSTVKPIRFRKVLRSPTRSRSSSSTGSRSSSPSYVNNPQFPLRPYSNRVGPYPDDEPYLMEIELLSKENPPKYTIKYFESGDLKDTKIIAVKTKAKILANLEQIMIQDVDHVLHNWVNSLSSKNKIVVRIKSYTLSNSRPLFCSFNFGNGDPDCITVSQDKKETFLDRIKDEEGKEIVLFEL